MKRTFYSIVLPAFLCCVFASCSNGAYDANPSSPANSSVNPLNPLTAKQFTWGGTDPFSANINGAGWTASSAIWYLDTGGVNIIVATKGSSVFYMALTTVWSGTVYDMGFKNYNRFAYYADSAGSSSGWYLSNLGNSGEVYISENDSLVIKGEFYFQGVNSTNGLINVSNGYFNIKKI